MSKQSLGRHHFAPCRTSCQVQGGCLCELLGSDPRLLYSLQQRDRSAGCIGTWGIRIPNLSQGALNHSLARRGVHEKCALRHRSAALDCGNEAKRKTNLVPTLWGLLGVACAVCRLVSSLGSEEGRKETGHTRLYRTARAAQNDTPGAILSNRYEEKASGVTDLAWDWVDFIPRPEPRCRGSGGGAKEGRSRNLRLCSAADVPIASGRTRRQHGHTARWLA